MEEHQILEAKLQSLRKYLQKNSINESELEVIIPVLKELDLLSSLIYKKRIDLFQRVTVNSWIPEVNGRVEFIKHLKNPPKECVKKYGRANIIGQSIFYGTFDYITALSEMRPEVNETITVSHWKLKTDYDLCLTPIFKNSSKNGIVHNELSLRASVLAKDKLLHYKDNIRGEIEIILQFIADAFSKEVEEGNHYDYYLSSHYANRLLYEFENGKIDGILYPSVRQSLTLSNIALKPEVFNKHFKLEKVEESVIISKPTSESKGWIMEGTGYSTNFKEGKILWEKVSQ